MSSDCTFGTVVAYEGIGSVQQTEVGDVQGDVRDIDVPLQYVTSVRGMQVEGGDDWVESWVASETDSLRSTSFTPPTGTIESLRGGVSRQPESPRNFRITPSSGRVRLDQPVSLSQQVRLARSPATRLVSGLHWLLTPKAYSRIVAPLVAQEHREYFEAIRCGDERLARWIVVRMYVLIVCNALRAVVAPIVQTFRSAN